MARMLTDEDIAGLVPAETLEPSPIPTRSISSDEFMPAARTEKQRAVEARINRLGDELGRKNGMSRRAFFGTAAGLAASFVAMNDVYGPIFQVNRAEANSVDLSRLRAQSLSGQFIFDCHTHFLRDDTRLTGFIRAREAVGRTGWNPAIAGRPQTIEDLQFDNYVREIFFDSDTKVALISGSPSEEPRDWFLTNEMKAEARQRINDAAGSQRLLSHGIFTPGWDGWLERIDREAETLRPDAWKGYTVGDNTNKDLARHPWRMDDERVVYRGYEKFLRHNIRTVCVHKGLYPEETAQRWPNLLPYAKVDDVGRAARDWPQLNFVIYHAGFRNTGGTNPTRAAREWEQTGRIEWVTDLAEVRERWGVSNVYADLGQVFAQTCILEPRLCAAVLGQLIKGLGADHVVWGTDAVWSGSPQWQIEALRRIEIPEDMQRQFGFAPLGAADGPVKNGILGLNAAPMYGVRRSAGLDWGNDRFAQLKRDYQERGVPPTRLAYGYARPD